MNVATGAILGKDEEVFLMNCSSLGKAARNELYESRLKEKNIQLLETVPKTKKSTKKNSERREYDLAKETVFTSSWLCSLARFRSQNSHGLWNFLAFYLTERGLIRKPNKPELTTELKRMITKNIPTHLPPANHHVIKPFLTRLSILWHMLEKG